MAGKKKKRRIIIIPAVIILLIAVGVSVLMDIKRTDSIVKMPSGPPKNDEEKFSVQVRDILVELENGAEDIDWSRLDGTLNYIDARFDCADFRFQSLMRIMFDHGDKIPDEAMEKIKKSVLGFKYWMDEPGGDSMCYWSENHQILFAASEYLMGRMYPEEIFTNSGMTGAQHMEKARVRILDWLEMRWKYGFSEFYSNVYYNEDIAPMINLIDFCDDDEIVKKTTIIMDLLIYDYASQSYKGAFNSVSGRAYEGNRKGGESNSSREVTKHIFGLETGTPRGGMEYNFIVRNNYEIPQVLLDIGLDTSEAVIKASNGMDLDELKAEGYFGTDTRSNMMQWGMESFTNRQTVHNTMAVIRKYDMFSNEFLNDIKVLDMAVIRLLHLEPLISIIINPQTNGVAIQRGNTYTYKTADYSMYTAQGYQPGDYGDQQHVQGANINERFSVFHVHPAMRDGEGGAMGNSPMYWVGYGHLPHAVQDKNVQLAIYDLPKKKGMMENKLLGFTHAYFPTEKFDEVRLEGNYAFGRKDNTYVVFITGNELKLAEGKSDDLIQNGKKVFWVTQMGTEEEYSSFDNFVDVIKSNELRFDEKKMTLSYTAGGTEYLLEFGKSFFIDGELVNTEYPRFDSPYITAERKAEKLMFEFNGKSLELDFYNMTRIASD